VAGTVGEAVDRLQRVKVVPKSRKHRGTGACIREHGFRGALINGYSNVGPDESVQYLDDEPVLGLKEGAR
jgi:hypothetical protein